MLKQIFAFIFYVKFQTLYKNNRLLVHTKTGISKGRHDAILRQIELF